MSEQPKIIVLDDDPTGSQTVHSCYLLLRWDLDTLREALRDPAPIFFILANTRALTEAEAIATTLDICTNLKAALQAENITNYWLVSRSDSTLRGHFPAEPEAIAQVFGEFDACFHAPAFFEGGRITKEGTHYIAKGNQLTPVHQTEFAQDPVFKFASSFLPEFIAEKTQGAIAATNVDIVEPDTLPAPFTEYLLSLHNNKQVVLSATKQEDFDQLVDPIQQATHQGQKFLFRSAASLLTSCAHLGTQPIPAAAIAHYRQSPKPGIIFVGSYTKNTTEQLNQILTLDNVEGIEIDLAACQNNQSRKQFIKTIIPHITQLFAQNITPIIFTPRTFQPQQDPITQLQFGHNINHFFGELIEKLPSDLGYLISKGGNTTNQLLSNGFQLNKIFLLGQIIPGCCLVQTSTSHRFPALPIVLFPGNVGDRQSLITAYQRLQKP